MTKVWIAFWAVIIFSSIAWYALLLFYIGVKAWHEILQMARTLKARNALEKKE